MEGFACNRLLPQLNGKIDPRQVACRGHSTTDALLSMLQAIQGYLSDKTESIQKRALEIVFSPADSYSDALELARMKTLAYRRDNICKEYMYKMKDLNHPLHPLLPTRPDNTCPYTLRHKSDQRYFYRNVTTCRTKRIEDFFTFKYF